MAVEIGALVARFRADTTDLQRGAQEGRQALQQMGQQAQATGQDIEATAQRMAKSLGGTAQAWREILQQQGFERIGQGAQQTVSSIDQVTAATKRANAAMQDAGRVNVSPAMSALLDAQARSGEQSLNESRRAQQRQLDQLTRNREREIAESRQRFEGFLDTPQGGAADAVDRVNESTRLSETSIVRFGAALAGVNIGLSIAAGAGRLLHDNIQASLEAAVNLDRVARGLSFAYGSGAPAAGAFAQRLAPQANTTAAGVGQALSAGAPLTQYGLSGAQVQQLTARAADIAGRSGKPFEQVASDVLEAVRSGGSQLEQYGLRLDDARLKTESYGGALSSTFDRMTTAQQIGVRYNVFLDQTRDLQGSAASSANTLSGSFDRLGSSMDRLRERSGALTTGGLQGPAGALASWVDQIIGTGSGGDRRAIVPDQRALGGYRFVGGQAPEFDMPAILAANGMNPSTPPSFIGPIPLRGTDLLAAQANNAQDFAGRAQAEAQAQLTALQLQSEQRRLSVAEDLAGYRHAELDAQGRLIPLVLAQANLQDRINLASRDNLTTRQALIAAERAAQAPQNALSDLQYGDQRVELLSQVRQSRLLQGRDVSDVPDWDTLIRQHVGYQLAQPEIALRALDAGRAVDVVQQQRTGEDLARQQPLTVLEAQRRALEDQTIPLQAQLRLTQEREASVQRTLEAMELANTNSLVAAQTALNEANTVRLVADETARIAVDFSDHMVAGATALERSASAVAAARDAIAQTIPLVQQLELGGREGPPSMTGQAVIPVSVTINGASADTVAIVRQELDAFEQRVAAALARGRSSGAPSSSQLAGARR